MHRIVIASIIAGAGLFLGVALVSADGGPHGNFNATSEGCASCHRAHTAQADKLLMVDAGALCLTCHDGTSASLDVWDGADLSSDPRYRKATRNTDPVTDPAAAGVGIDGALKGGGVVYSRIQTGVITGSTSPVGAALANDAPGVLVTSSHVKFGTTAGTDGNALVPKNVIWGNGAISSGPGKAVTSLTCVDCHNPHGNQSYRILRPIPKQSGDGSVWLGDEVVPAGSGKAYTTTNYWTQYSADKTLPWMRLGPDGLPGTGDELAGTGAQMSDWCSTCHTRYKTASFSDSGDAIFKYRHISDGTSGRAGGAGSSYGPGTPDEGTIFTTQCLQCHVSHGSSAVMATNRGNSRMPWPDGTTDRGTESALLKINGRGVCVACHGTTPGS